MSDKSLQHKAQVESLSISVAAGTGRAWGSVQCQKPVPGVCSGLWDRLLLADAAASMSA